MARPRAGTSGIALFVAAGGLYLAYAGVRDVPLVTGLRSLLRGERPVERQASYVAVQLARSVAASEGDSPEVGKAGVITGDTGISGLRGSARMAYVVLKSRFPNLRMGGWRPAGSVPNSDHPKGLAIDVMTTSDPTAQQVIKVMRLTPGLRLWIWNRHYAEAPDWQIRPCGTGHCGPSAHTDHVHGSWT